MTSAGSIPEIEAMIRPVEKSCHAFWLVRGVQSLAHEDGLDGHDDQEDDGECQIRHGRVRFS